MEADERQRAVQDAIRQLPGEIRELVLLHYIEGLSKKEIARRRKKLRPRPTAHAFPHPGQRLGSTLRGGGLFSIPPRSGGIAAYRDQLLRLLGNRPFSNLPHEAIIARLDKAGEMFRILILKTNMTLPYTSVFIELDCGYWSAEAEQKLRQALAPAKK